MNKQALVITHTPSQLPPNYLFQIWTELATGCVTALTLPGNWLPTRTEKSERKNFSHFFQPFFSAIFSHFSAGLKKMAIFFQPNAISTRVKAVTQLLAKSLKKFSWEGVGAKKKVGGSLPTTVQPVF